jgi:hypothetical protein
MEADVLSVLLPAEKASAAAEYENNGLKKEEELGIFKFWIDWRKSQIC